ncbi:MAG: hypothetical protein ABI867_27805 [Kofleriaceae bacterium]
MRLVVIAVMLAGCSFGMGSAYVGQWSPKKQVEFEACLVETAMAADVQATSNTCVDKKQVVTEVPGRKYWGVILSMLTMGAARVEFEGQSSTEFRFQPGLEYLQGRGRWALGVRAGLLLDGKSTDGVEGGATAAATVALLGHVSIFDQMSLYGGVGYLPYGGTGDDRTFLGVQGLGGFQYALNKTHSETYIVLSFEVDHTYLQLGDGYRSTGFTGHFGIFF